MVGLWHCVSHLPPIRVSHIQDSVTRQDGSGDIHVVDVHFRVRLGQQRQGNVEDRLSHVDHVARPEDSVIFSIVDPQVSTFWAEPYHIVLLHPHDIPIVHFHKPRRFHTLRLTPHV